MEEKLPASSRMEIGNGVVTVALQFLFPNAPIIGGVRLPTGLLIIAHGAFPELFKKSFWDGTRRFYALVGLLCVAGLMLSIRARPRTRGTDQSLAGVPNSMQPAASAAAKPLVAPSPPKEPITPNSRRGLPTNLSSREQPPLQLACSLPSNDVRSWTETSHTNVSRQ